MFSLQVGTEVFPFLLSLESNFLQIFTTDFKIASPEKKRLLDQNGTHQVIQTVEVNENELFLSMERTEDIF